MTNLNKATYKAFARMVGGTTGMAETFHKMMNFDDVESDAKTIAEMIASGTVENVKERISKKGTEMISFIFENKKYEYPKTKIENSYFHI